MKNRNNATALFFLVTVWVLFLLFMGNSVYKNAIEFTGPKFKIKSMEELLDGHS